MYILRIFFSIDNETEILVNDLMEDLRYLYRGIYFIIGYMHFIRYILYHFFSISIFFHRHGRFTGKRGKRGDHLLFHTTASTRSLTLRYLFASLRFRWLSRILNGSTCVYQTVSRWDLPPYRIVIWLIDWCNAMFICVLDDLSLGFLYSGMTWETGGIELAWTITLVLQANRLTKHASHPKWAVIVTYLYFGEKKMLLD